MKRIALTLCIIIAAALTAANTHGQTLESLWQNPPQESHPWNYWYWMDGAYTREGITADLEAMAENGIAGSYQFTIGGVPDTPLIEPSYTQLTPEWWDIWSYAVREADRLGRKIAFNTCDGWALAGGPWITPELSMQIVTWSRTHVTGGGKVNIQLEKPWCKMDWYRDIATFAYPARKGEGVSSFELQPKVTGSDGRDISFIARKGNDTHITTFGPYTMSFSFEEPFTARCVYVRPRNCNYYAQRLILEVSDDGETWRRITRFDAPRMGWYGGSETGFNWNIPETTAKYWRFINDPEGGEAMDEDMDKPKGFEIFSLFEIGLYPNAFISQYEGKNGSAWRVSPDDTSKDIRRRDCVRPQDIIDISEFVSEDGTLNWDAPKGEWIILRMGSTTNGAENGPAGGAVGLECDKFNPEAIQLQLDSWIGHLRDIVGAEVFSRVVKYIHVDSWECGCQNWSPVFREQFLKRRGYDIQALLPLYAGVPIKNVKFSESVLRDVRNTICEMLADTFSRMVMEYAHSLGCEFSAEAIAPATLAEDMLHYKYADLPMGEFWLNSPTQDKPSDILDATSAAHIYGKSLVGAEAFTETSIDWNEYPGMLKSLQDLEYACGINRFIFHVNVHNPWMGARLPGKTLWNYGLFFQRDQTWWKQAKAWMDYTIRCQTMLQAGVPVVDLAVWTGDDLPRRAVHQQRMVPLFPGVFGPEKVAAEQERLSRNSLERATSAIGVQYTAGTTLNTDWINPMHGYKYDSINSDALINMAEGSGRRITLQGGMSYAALVLPPPDIHMPNPVITKESAKAIRKLRKAGVPVIDKFPYRYDDFRSIGIEPDFSAIGEDGTYLEGLKFCHRRTDAEDIYFIANNDPVGKSFTAGLRVSGRVPELWLPVTGEIIRGTEWTATPTGISMPLTLAPYESVFVVLRDGVKESTAGGNSLALKEDCELEGPWTVHFKSASYEGTAQFESLSDWIDNDNPQIRYYSGTATYSKDFTITRKEGARYFISFDQVCNLATVRVNGKDCGTIWTEPFRAEVTDALTDGVNRLEIDVVNTWSNHIKGVLQGKIQDKYFWSTIPERKHVPMLSSGITGRAVICSSER